MFCQLVLLVVLAACTIAGPIDNYDDIPEEYKAMIPEEFSVYLKITTAEEKAVFKDLAKQHIDFNNESEFLAALKKKSPSLHSKTVKLHAIINGKVDALGKEAKEFVKKVIAEGRKIHQQYLSGDKPSLDQLKKCVKIHVSAYEALSAEAKEEFKKGFPILTAVFKNPKVKAVADKYLPDY